MHRYGYDWKEPTLVGSPLASLQTPLHTHIRPDKPHRPEMCPSGTLGRLLMARENASRHANIHQRHDAYNVPAPLVPAVKEALKALSCTPTRIPAKMRFK